MKRSAILLAAILLGGCGGGGGSNREGSVSIYFDDESSFSGSTIGFTSFDHIEGARDVDLAAIYLESGSRSLEVVVDAPSVYEGLTVDLEDNLDSGVFYKSAFGNAEGVAGTIHVVRLDNDQIQFRLNNVLLADADGDGEAIIDGTVTYYFDRGSRGLSWPVSKRTLKKRG
jgi:hypothetical protein